MKEARPTSGRVLAALFNILGGMIRGGMENLSFLDLFAGTGRVGIEALKRGAASVVLVETMRKRAEDIRRSCPRERAGDVTVLSLELRRSLAWLNRRERTFDVVFADPPYGEGWNASLLRTPGFEKVLKKDGILVVEHASGEILFVPPNWTVADARVYGGTALTFLEKTPEEASL